MYRFWYHSWEVSHLVDGDDVVVVQAGHHHA